MSSRKEILWYLGYRFIEMINRSGTSFEARPEEVGPAKKSIKW